MTIIPDIKVLLFLIKLRSLDARRLFKKAGTAIAAVNIFALIGMTARRHVLPNANAASGRKIRQKARASDRTSRQRSAGIVVPAERPATRRLPSHVVEIPVVKAGGLADRPAVLSAEMRPPYVIRATRPRF